MKSYSNWIPRSRSAHKDREAGSVLGNKEYQLDTIFFFLTAMVMVHRRLVSDENGEWFKKAISTSAFWLSSLQLNISGFSRSAKLAKYRHGN